MTSDELHTNLISLIDDYVIDEVVKTKLLSLAAKQPIPAKGILAELDPFLTGPVTERDVRIVKEIVFFFC